MAGVQFVVNKVYVRGTLLSKMAKRKLEEWDLGVQSSPDKASINFVEYPIEGGREINKVTNENPL